MSDAEPDDLQTVEALFQAAADRPQSERGAFLAASGADADVCSRVEALLARLEADESLPSPHLGSAAEDAAELEAGARIGRWCLVEELGVGGFGVVWRARQEGPVSAAVALKLIKLGMDTREVLARFDAEREALARMDHPGIARVLDAGVSDTGRPYFVMELVEGDSVTEHCDNERLDTRARLELFVEVCRAIQHAHQKGVVHRDLKPSNVLVSRRGGEQVPKVIDFGIAKAIQGRLGEHSLMTVEGRLVGTPAYMSPEQAGGSLDVDTRADIYSLGVLLYELLTGSTPFGDGQLLREGLVEARRVICETIPERPSSRIAASGDEALAQRRATDTQTLERHLRGDLDWIVGKALEKEPARRYATTSELAADIERHLAAEPVSAGPPSTTYRLRKALFRHRAAFGTAASLLVVLIAGIVGTSLAMIEAGRQRDEAIAAERDAQAVEDFMVRTLALADPEVAQTPDLSVRSLLDQASIEVAERFADQPRAEARIRATLGRAYAKLGENRVAEAHLSRAAELAAQPQLGQRNSRPALDPLEHYATLWALTHVSFWLERPDAHEVSRAARAVGLGTLEEEHPELAGQLARLEQLGERGAYTPDPAAIEELVELVPVCAQASRDALGDGDPRWPVIADTFIADAYMFWFSPFEERSLVLLEAALEIQRRELGVAHPETAKTLVQKVGVLRRAGRGAEAENELREAALGLRASHARGSYSRAVAESMLGALLAESGRFEEAESWLTDSHSDLVASLGDASNFLVQDSYARVIDLYQRWGKVELAQQHRIDLARGIIAGQFVAPYAITVQVVDDRWGALREALQSLHELLGEVTFSLDETGPAPAGIEALAFEVVQPLTATPADDPRTRALSWLVLRFAAMIPLGGEGHAARKQLTTAVRSILSQGAQSADSNLAEAEAILALLEIEQGELERGRELALQARESLGDLPAAEHWAYWIQALRTAHALERAGEGAAARSILEPATVSLEAQLGREHPSAVAARTRLAGLRD